MVRQFYPQASWMTETQKTMEAIDAIHGRLTISKVKPDALPRDVIEKLLSAGINISAYDPVAMDFAKKILSEKITYAQDMYEALNAADALIIVTEWPQFKEPDFLRIKQLIKSKLIFDGRNIYSQERMRELGFTYHSIGRPPVH